MYSPHHVSPDEPVIITAEQHIQQQQRQHSPEASGRFSWLLAGLTLATKLTESRVRRAGLLDVLGSAEHVNVQGEMQQKLDIFADQALRYCLGKRESVAVIASEENEEAIIFPDRNTSGTYVIVFDPLDGSSNIDVNVSVGTVFSILRVPDGVDVAVDASRAVLQPGTEQLAAGYVVYGSSTILVYTTGHGVHGFTLDPTIGAYVLSHENIRMPDQGPYYSTNEAYWEEFPEYYHRYLSHLKSGGLGRRYSQRYIGSMVADFHRTLLKGGIFLYPPTAEAPGGKLRLLYEANPVAFLAEQAGGLALDGRSRVMEIEPKQIHQRTPLVVGSRVEMEAFQKFID